MKAMIQQVFTMFLVHPRDLTVTLFSENAGKQLELKFHWFAKIYIDMKKAVGERVTWLKGFECWKKEPHAEIFKNATNWMKTEVATFKAEFQATGDTSKCPEYVYFIGE